MLHSSADTQEVQTCSQTRKQVQPGCQPHLPLGPRGQHHAAPRMCLGLQLPLSPWDLTPLQPPDQRSPRSSSVFLPHNTRLQAMGLFPAALVTLLCPSPPSVPGAGWAERARTPAPPWVLYLQASLSKDRSPPNRLSLSHPTWNKGGRHW